MRHLCAFWALFFVFSELRKSQPSTPNPGEFHGWTTLRRRKLEKR